MLSIVGGVYLEQCLSMPWDYLYGSGGRAAAALSQRSAAISLTTYIGQSDQEQLRLLGDAFGFTVQATVIERTVSFEYFHALGIPTIRPALHQLVSQPPLKVQADKVLRFGMMEGEAIVQGDRVVYDPQSGHKALPFHANGSTAEHLAVVCNHREGWQLTGEREPERIAQALLGSGQTEVVVLKMGPRGCQVTTAQSQQSLPAYRTPNVWPIGSGDVFAAIFAYHWAWEARDPFEAAELASRSTAHYCANPVLPVPDASQPQTVETYPPLNLLQLLEGEEPTVYLAGPFFSMGQRYLIEQARNALLTQGVRVFSPVHDVGYGAPREVAPADLKGLDQARVVLALVSGGDPGTLFEVGWARAKGIPVVAFSETEPQRDLTMLLGTDCEVCRDFPTAIYHTVWKAMEA